MNCNNVQDLLPLYVGGDLDAEKMRLVTTHVRSCSTCGVSADEYRKSFRMVQSFVPPSFSEELYSGIRQQVLREIRRDPILPRAWTLGDVIPSVFRLNPRWAVVSSALLLAMAIGALFFLGDNQRNQVVKTGVESKSPASTPSITPSSKEQDEVRAAVPSTMGQRATRRSALHNGRIKHITPRAPVVDEGNRDLATNNSARQAPTVFPTVTGTDPLAVSVPATTPEKPLRVEMQTNDRNIRIIWFSYPNTKQDPQGKFPRGI
ncbi:MAG TPA: zf-HC2 domain-containing protein [Pyrinomonadaceae bacterium]|nr:zf-HC2 domain-containing protein [Pyrinomonadaceae bacterium]